MNDSANRLLGRGYRFEWALDSIADEDFGDVDRMDVDHVECLTLLNPLDQQVDHLGGVFMPSSVSAQRATRRTIENEMASAHVRSHV